MTIKIEIYGEDAGQALSELKGLSAGLLGNTALTPARYAAERELSKTAQEAKVEPVIDESGSAGAGAAPLTEVADDKRLVGKAGGDRSRRTKAEIAEDATLEAAAELAGITIEQLNSGIAQAGRVEAEKAMKGRIAANEQAGRVEAAISTGENRVGPEDDAETAAQDAADEAAEVEANREPEKPLTADDLKQAMGLYVQKFGLAETQDDGPALFNSALGEPPADEQFWKVTLVAAQGQETLKKAVDAWKAAAAGSARFVAKGV